MKNGEQQRQQHDYRDEMRQSPCATCPQGAPTRIVHTIHGKARD